jgi:hypothetical protein
VPEFFEQQGRVVEGRADLRLQDDVRQGRLQHPADPQPPHRAVGAAEERLARRKGRRPQRIAGHRPRHRVEHRGGVPDGPRERPVGAQAGDLVAQRRAADPAAAGLEAEQPVDARGDTDRPASVAALRERCQPGGDRHRRSPAGAAGQPAAVPRAARRPGQRVVGVAGVAELRCVRLPQADRPGRGQLLDDGVVRGGHELGHHERAERRPDAGCVVEVLDSGRDAEQRRQVATAMEDALSAGSGPQGALRRDSDEGTQPRVLRRDPGQVVLDQLGGPDVAGTDGGGLLQCGEVVQLRHGRRR